MSQWHVLGWNLIQEKKKQEAKNASVGVLIEMLLL